MQHTNEMQCSTKDVQQSNKIISKLFFYVLFFVLQKTRKLKLIQFCSIYSQCLSFTTSDFRQNKKEESNWQNCSQFKERRHTKKRDFMTALCLRNVNSIANSLHLSFSHIYCENAMPHTQRKISIYDIFPASLSPFQSLHFSLI